MSDINVTPVSTKVDISANLTKSAETVTSTITEPARTINKGICKLFSALTGKWFAHCDRQTKLIAAHTEKDAEAIRAGLMEYRDDKLISLAEVQTKQEYYARLSETNATCDAKRLEASMLAASIEMKDVPDDQISDEPLDQTFFNHWRKEAELIDDDELRTWWAHLLVEETKKPKSISPRTLDVAKNLSKQEANLFIQVSKGMIGNAIMVNGDGYPLYGTYSNILSLQDARLVASQTSFQTFEHIQENEHAVIVPFLTSKLAILFEKDKIRFQCNCLTTAGQEIHNISKTPQTLEEIKKIAKEVSRQNNNAVASILPIEIISQKVNDSQQYRYFWLPLWTNRPPAETNGDNK